MTDFPTLDGLLGPLDMHDSHVWATDETHVGLTCHITLRKLEYRVRLDVNLQSDGSFDRGQEGENMSAYHALIMERTWDYPGGKARPETSFAARDKAEDILTRWMQELLTSEQGIEMLVSAGRAKRAGVISSTQAKIAKLQEELADAEAELTALSA